MEAKIVGYTVILTPAEDFNFPELGAASSISSTKYFTLTVCGGGVLCSP